MPAERSRYSRRAQADGPGIVWTLPVEPVDESGIAFAPTLTEDAFADIPPLVDAPPLSPCESFIFADEYSPSPASPSTRKSAHARKKSASHVPRPPNAFILFRSSFIKSQHVSTEVETSHSTLSKIIGITWKNLAEDEREFWRQKAVDAVAEHKRNFPTYAFRPKHSRGKKGDPDGAPPKAKRKVREVYQDPQRCKKIAELLVEGKTGTELDKAIQEFDKHHVPQVVTRFEAPITARAYRRSSSVPAPNSEDSRAFLASTPATFEAAARRRRSSSVGAASRVSHEQAQPHKPRTASIFTDIDLSGSSTPVSPSMFDSFSFGSKQEPDADFDFSAFSFANHTAPSPAVGCDPLSLPLSPCSPLEVSSFDHKLQPPSPAVYTPAEAIDVSAFIASEWLLHGDSPNPFAGYPAVDYTMPEFAYPPPAYSMSPSEHDHGFCSSFKKSLGFQEQPSYCAPQDAMAQLEADLASFMAQYSL